MNQPSERQPRPRISAPSGAEPRAGSYSPTAATGETGWQPSQGPTRPDAPVVPGRRRPLRNRLLAGTGVAAVLTTTLAIGGSAARHDGDSSIQATGPGDNATTLTVDNQGTSRHDLANGTITITAPVETRSVKLVDHSTPTALEPHTRPQAFAKDQTVSTVIEEGLERVGFNPDTLTDPQINTVIAGIASANPDHENMNLVLGPDNGPRQTTLQVFDDPTLATLASAASETQPNGDPVDPRVITPAMVTAADIVEQAVADHGYSSTQARVAGAALLTTIGVASPDQAATGAGQDGAHDHDTQPIGPILNPEQRAAMVGTLAAQGWLDDKAKLRDSSLWAQVGVGGIAPENAISRVNTEASRANPAISPDGNFDPRQLQRETADQEGSPITVLTPKAEALVAILTSLDAENTDTFLAALPSEELRAQVDGVLEVNRGGDPDTIPQRDLGVFDRAGGLLAQIDPNSQLVTTVVDAFAGLETVAERNALAEQHMGQLVQIFAPLDASDGTGGDTGANTDVTVTVDLSDLLNSAGVPDFQTTVTQAERADTALLVPEVDALSTRIADANGIAPQDTAGQTQADVDARDSIQGAINEAVEPDIQIPLPEPAGTETPLEEVDKNFTDSVFGFTNGVYEHVDDFSKEYLPWNPTGGHGIITLGALAGTGLLYAANKRWRRSPRRPLRRRFGRRRSP